MRIEDFTTAKGRELRTLMGTVPGWRYVNGLRTFGVFGRQRYYERIEKWEVVKEGIK